MMDTAQAGCTGPRAFKDLPCQSRISNVGRGILSQDIRKAYPLRRRLSPAMNEKTCTVVLTRLEDVAGSCIMEGQSGAQPNISCWVDDFGTLKVHTGHSSKTQRVTSKGKRYSRVTSDNIHDFPEPRKRRLASLNAEAVNNVLFERDDGCSRKIRKDFGKASENGISDEDWTSSKNPNCLLHSKRSRQRYMASSQSPDKVFESNVKVEDKVVSYSPTPKRLASLNAVAFLKLTNERGHPLKQRSKSHDDTSRPITGCSKSKLKPIKSHKKNCVQSKKELLHRKVEDHHGWQEGGDSGFLKPEHRNSSKSSGKTEGVHVERSSNNYDGSESLYHRLPLMGGQASMKPEYGRPGEKSPTPKQDFQQPSFPIQQLHHLPVPGSLTDCVCLCHPSDVTSLDGTYISYGQSGLPYSGYCEFSVYPKDELFSQPVPCEELLVSQSSFPPSGMIGHLPWCNSRYSFGEDTGTNTDSLCGLRRLPISRVTNTHVEHKSYSFKKPITAEVYKSRDQLSLSIPTAGRPVSPAHPLSGCPAPSVPPAAEPVPYMQTPNSEPQTMAMLKTTRECPQSSKPPSGSKSGVRNTTGCFHSSSNKTSKSHSHPKQQRIHSRRSTNGWMPVGAACEKEVFVVNEPEPALRRSYQAVERNGEIIRIRDTVLLKSGPRKKSMPYVAKISALWEEPKTGELMMSLFWYYRPEHTQGGRNPSMHEREIFASRHQDENSIACIEEKCYVLTFAEYCRFCALVKRRGEGCPNRKALIVPPSAEYSTPSHRRVPDSTDPGLVFLCRHVYDFRHGRILKNPQ
ncbi:bromo adjacent homology domain-containing 1 protein [Xenopus laevis]|uniref:Bromo adjacent homology domain-containing 1 protein n=1 Tax=Xenopus laevis TaxID=8355 RepID=A0A8J1LP76_XENLA|nr:bromo adjacent homology domain-containing 1 protein [Xenopus laevis]XP_041431348.1 bromo adjacent homology domain-containing 1 protein [Xenopus laevis]